MNLKTIREILDARNPSLKVEDKHAREIACAVVGETICQRTWQNWKRIDTGTGAPLVAAYSRTLSFGQALILMAIAYDRRFYHKNKPLPSDAEIWGILQSPKHYEILSGYVDDSIRTGVTKRELPAILKKHGITHGCERASLYRKFSSYPWWKGRKRFYKPQIDQMLKILRSDTAINQ